MDNSVLEHAAEMRYGSHWSFEHVLSRELHWEPQLTILAFSVNNPLPDLPSLSEMDNSVLEDATEMR